MKTFVYVCKDEAQAETAEELCRGHNCPDDQITRYPLGKVVAYEGADLDPFVDEESAIVVVGTL